jgi:hypothetical protein
VVERLDNGESAVEVSAWLVDLGYWVGPDEVALIAARYRQQQEGTTGAGGGDPR